MKDGPNIARVAALIGDPARAEVLTALLADRALTVSAHLAKLVEAGLLAVEAQGRHRYFRLAGRDIAQLLESLMGVAFRTGAVRVRAGPREPALRKARVCYDHLAGELAVIVYEGLHARGVLAADGDGLALTPTGSAWFGSFGIDAAREAGRHRAFCRPCLDWGERRHHLGGALGAALLKRLYELGWASRARDSRVVSFTPKAEQELRFAFAA
jgi:hypothetical protein